MFHGENGILPVSLRAWQLGWWQSNLLSYGIIARAADKSQVRKHSFTEYLPQDSISEYLLLKIMLSA